MYFRTKDSILVFSPVSRKPSSLFFVQASSQTDYDATKISASSLFAPTIVSIIMTDPAKNNNCEDRTVVFIVKEGDPEMAVVEDDIREDLAKIGIKVELEFLDEAEYIEREMNGDYNLFFTRTWGAPYDPHTYLSSWDDPAHVEYTATGNFDGSLTRDEWLDKVAKTLKLTDDVEIRSMWKEILEDIHKQAIFLPLWGTRVPYVLNRRFAGFVPSSQTYSYPIESVQVLSGSKNVTVAPGSGGVMFTSLGDLHPHMYSPNQLFSQAWLYEGLVSYGQDGEIIPALATKWETEEISGAGQRITFTLRQGVKFHDGTTMTCRSVKLNFDHVLSEGASQRHIWMGAVQVMENWFCNDEGQFILETNAPFYPLLQELTYIRPLTIASPSSFPKGFDTDPELENSCNPGVAKWEEIEALENFACLGLNSSIGTGPFNFVSREQDADGNDISVLFAANQDYWGVVPDIEFLELKNFPDTQTVEDALLAGDLDMALGIGPLSAKQIQKLKFYHSDVVDVRHSDVLQHSLLVMNTNKHPTSDIKVRQAIIHAINKGRFIEDEFGGLEQPVSQLLPDSAPYCDVDLTPKWAYDLDKALLLACPSSLTNMENKSGLSQGGLAGVSIVGVAVLGLLAFVMYLISREKQGKPLFVSDNTDKGENA